MKIQAISHYTRNQGAIQSFKGFSEEPIMVDFITNNLEIFIKQNKEKISRIAEDKMFKINLNKSDLGNNYLV